MSLLSLPLTTPHKITPKAVLSLMLTFFFLMNKS